MERQHIMHMIMDIYSVCSLYLFSFFPVRFIMANNLLGPVGRRYDSYIVKRNLKFAKTWINSEMNDTMENENKNKINKPICVNIFCESAKRTKRRINVRLNRMSAQHYGEHYNRSVLFWHRSCLCACLWCTFFPYNHRLCRCIRRWLSTVESLLLAVSHDAQLNKNLLGLITHGSFIHTLNYELGTWTRLVIVSIKWTNFMSSLNHITCYEKEIEHSVIEIVLH